MSKQQPTSLTATYRPNGDGEVFQVSLEAGRLPYPDALAEMKATVTGTMHDVVADVIEQYAKRDAQASAD